MSAEVVHGVLRTLLLAPLVGDLPARQIGVFIGSLLVLGITSLLVGWIRAGTAPRLLVDGLRWVVLTLLFEFALGRLVLDLSWDRLAEDYNLSRGGLMPLGLTVVALAPLLMARVRYRGVAPSGPRGGDLNPMGRR
jgi:hypothetical protein